MSTDSPALMYLTWPATHTTKLPCGRPSTSCLRLRSYSVAGIPGVSSPGLTVHTNALSVTESASEYGLTEMGMGFRSGLANGGRLGDEMMGMHLSSVCTASRRTNDRTLHESERTRTQRHVLLTAPVTRPMPATALLSSIDDQRWQNNGHCFFDFEEKSTQAVYNIYSTCSLTR